MNEKGEKFKCSKNEVQQFRQLLNGLADVYVNDAFGTMHRAHSSIVGIEKKLKAAGMLVEKELDHFGRLLESKQKNTTVVLGGAKVADKIPIVKNLIGIADDILIGGGMAFTFLKVKNGYKIGKSTYDNESASKVKEILELAEQKGVKIHLPVDIVCAKELSDSVKTKVIQVSEGLPEDMAGYDIGPETIELFSRVLSRSNVILMNGLMGVFENEPFKQGSVKILEKIAEKTSKGATSIVGGGDTTGCVEKLKLKDKISHVSTGGGASLELLGGIELPGIKHLSDKSVLDR